MKVGSGKLFGGEGSLGPPVDALACMDGHARAMPSLPGQPALHQPPKLGTVGGT